MLLIILLYTPAFATDSYDAHNTVTCDGIFFQDVYYDREVLVKNLGRPYNLVLHKYSGYLFFSHTIRDGDQVDFGIMSCHVDSKECKPITGVPGGYAIGYDKENDELYFGGHDGIYKYNFRTTKAEFFEEDGKSIWAIFIRRNFYYIEYPSQRLYVYKHDKFVTVYEDIGIEVFNFFITKNLEIYFSNKTALYKVDRTSEFPIMLDDETVVRQIVEDTYGDVYFCNNDGIHMEDKPYKRLKRIALIEQCFGMTFDEQQRLLYSDTDNIYRLNPSQDAQYCYDKLIYSKRKRNQS
ncbi:unnamed protein product, partial [Iphiclides podalirius]